MNDIITFAFEVGEQLIKLGQVLYDFFTKQVMIPTWLLDAIRFIFPDFVFTSVSMWSIIGGGSIVFFILWSIFGW